MYQIIMYKIEIFLEEDTTRLLKLKKKNPYQTWHKEELGPIFVFGYKSYFHYVCKMLDIICLC